MDNFISGEHIKEFKISFFFVENTQYVFPWKLFTQTMIGFYCYIWSINQIINGLARKRWASLFNLTSTHKLSKKYIYV